jgi:hypothetical protein
MLAPELLIAAGLDLSTWTSSGSSGLSSVCASSSRNCCLRSAKITWREEGSECQGGMTRGDKVRYRRRGEGQKREHGPQARGEVWERRCKHDSNVHGERRECRRAHAFSHTHHAATHKHKKPSSGADFGVVFACGGLQRFQEVFSVLPAPFQHQPPQEAQLLRAKAFSQWEALMAEAETPIAKPSQSQVVTDG